MNLLRKIVMMTALFSSVGCTAELKMRDTAAVEKSPITWKDCSQQVGDHPCDFSLLDQNGADWTLYDHFGSIIVLDFSTEWCGYCQRGALTIQDIQDEYAENDVILVTILIEDRYGNPASPELLTAWSTHFGIDAPVLAGSRDLLSSDPALGWPVTSYPSYFFIDRGLTLRSNQPGYSDAGLRAAIDSMLSEEIES